MINSDNVIQSPCIRNCCLNEDDVCLGCFRTLSEVVGWAGSDDELRQQILVNTKERRLAYQNRYKPHC
ncbi:MAG: DUF1289 domain-containing protein [Methyloglobulus sp.]|nr:DUF1289 domain-containing protein [Methyloglobulus sp.]